MRYVLMVNGKLYVIFTLQNLVVDKIEFPFMYKFSQFIYYTALQ